VASRRGSTRSARSSALATAYDAPIVEVPSAAQAFFDQHQGVVLTAVVIGSSTGGLALNARFGPITPLRLLPSTVGAMGAGATAFVSHNVGHRRVCSLAVATAAGMLLATLGSHVGGDPAGGLLARKPTTPAV
jgi:hypothetical protein